MKIVFCILLLVLLHTAHGQSYWIRYERIGGPDSVSLKEVDPEGVADGSVKGSQNLLVHKIRRAELSRQEVRKVKEMLADAAVQALTPESSELNDVDRALTLSDKSDLFYIDTIIVYAIVSEGENTVFYMNAREEKAPTDLAKSFFEGIIEESQVGEGVYKGKVKAYISKRKRFLFELAK